ncbi:hypothetical protein BLNAU_11670 [Blattamonas nauphoetae]|uniref:Uncharacterized protein n=1 Tax=Blattamonas nauphoetae TaxID=2049346 RepID=A0ABQ9XPC2_9EUKA|nr:hypothetical protein BLNAU_11670 [Blattamonas nauphoetae]
MSESLLIGLTLDCPVVYGNDSVPILTLSIIHAILTLMPLYQFLKFMISTRLKQGRAKKGFLAMLAFYHIMRSMTAFVPFPHNAFSNMLFCDQIPRFGLFIAWQLFTIWLGQTLGKATKKRRRRHCTNVSFSLLFFALFIAGIIVSVIYMNEPEGGQTGIDYAIYLFVVDALTYITIIVSAAFASIRLTRLLLKVHILKEFKSRIILALVLIIIFGMMFFVRLIYIILNQAKVNPIAKKLVEYARNFEATGQQLSSYYAGHLVFYLIFEIIPVLLLNLLYFSLSLPVARQGRSANQHLRDLPKLATAQGDYSEQFDDFEQSNRYKSQNSAEMSAEPASGFVGDGNTSEDQWGAVEGVWEYDDEGDRRFSKRQWNDNPRVSVGRSGSRRTAGGDGLKDSLLENEDG